MAKANIAPKYLLCDSAPILPMIPRTGKIETISEITSDIKIKNINVRIPLECMTVVTGVSGSGKSSLIIDILSNYLMNHFYPSGRQIGRHDRVEGVSNIDKVIIIDQSPIGKTPHSNIATYTGLFTHVREVFAASLDAQKRGFGPGRFSFNTK